MADPVTVAIAVPLEAELVEALRAADPRVKVAYAPELLPPVRYPNDHQGVDDFRRAPEDERRWWEMIAGAEVLYEASSRSARKAAAAGEPASGTGVPQSAQGAAWPGRQSARGDRAVLRSLPVEVGGKFFQVVHREVSLGITARR
jgi:hypothetical protein